LRADVTAGLYGGALIPDSTIYDMKSADRCGWSGHYERKMKHLENQKEAKRKMKRLGRVDLPQEAFFDILSVRRP
jgi:translation elongation factor EF-4